MSELTQIVQPVTQTVQPVADVVQPVTKTVQPVTQAVQQVADVVQPVTQAVQPVVQPVTQAVQPVVQPVTQAVQPVVQPVTQAVQPVVQPVTQAVQPVVQPVTHTVQPVVQPVADAVQPVADATGGAVGTATQTAGSLTDAASVGATVGKTAGQATAALDGASGPIHGVLGHVGAESAGLSEKVAALAGTGGPGGVLGGPGGVLGGPGDTFGGPDGIHGLVGENPAPIGTGIPDVGGPASGNGGVFDAIPFEAPGLIAGAQEALILSAGLVTLAGVALAVRPSAVMSAQFFLANVRQIPACGVREIVNRQVSTAVAGTARLGVASGGAVKGSAGAAKGIAEDIAKDIRDGFLRGVAGSADDGLSDTRLLMQIGMLLGTLYLAFLTVWFWATRLRWNPRT